MGSKKKRAEKKKDFVKQKLKVGKTAAKPDNFTDTSFTARTISLPNQSISKKSSESPKLGGDVDLSHHLSLTRHHSSTTRKEVLAYIESHLPRNPSIYKQIILMTVPLITDQSQSVRLALVSLLLACVKMQPGLLQLHIRSIVLYIQSSMSHIQPDIRNTSTKFLKLMLENDAKTPLVNLYFVKTLKCFFTLMAWNLTQDKKSVSLAITTSASIGGLTKKARVDHLKVLKIFLSEALIPPETTTSNDLLLTHPQSSSYLLPDVPQVFAPLKLFIKTTSTSNENNGDAYNLQDLDNVTTEDADTRRKIMVDVFMAPMIKSLNSLVKEGGEVGKEANECIKVLDTLSSE